MESYFTVLEVIGKKHNFHAREQLTHRRLHTRANAWTVCCEKLKLAVWEMEWNLRSKIFPKWMTWLTIGWHSSVWYACDWCSAHLYESDKFQGTLASINFCRLGCTFKTPKLSIKIISTFWLPACLVPLEEFYVVLFLSLKALQSMICPTVGNTKVARTGIYVIKPGRNVKLVRVSPCNWDQLHISS